MDFKTRTITTVVLLILAILATVGCEITEDQKATRTAEALEDELLSRSSVQSGFAARTAVKSDDDAGTGTASGGNDGEVQVLKRDASADGVKAVLVTATAAPTPETGSTTSSGPQSTATTSPAPPATPTSDPVAAPLPTATSAPAATSIPVATSVPVPTPVPSATTVPTATPVPETGPWLTALQAFEIATDAQAGVVKEIIGHVAHQAGELDVGDDSSNIPSPGAGYSSSWNVSIVDGDESLLCVVRGPSVSCDTSFGAPDAELAGVSIDSPAVFDKWAKTPEWSELMAQENISILLALQPWPGGLQWTASITVNGASAPPYGGNFIWNLDSGETGFVTY